MHPTDQLLTIDARLLNRLRLFRKGQTSVWKAVGRDETLSIEINVIDSATINLAHHIDGDTSSTESVIRIHTHLNNFGRDRVCFSCPRCQRVVAILYYRDNRFKCWQCQGIPYYSGNRKPIHAVSQKDKPTRLLDRKQYRRSIIRKLERFARESLR